MLRERFLRGDMIKLGATPDMMRRRHPGEPTALAPAQEQLWLFERSNPGLPPLYNESFTIYRTGPLDVDVLQRCLTEIVRRHEIWRTTYDLANGQPVQIIHEPPMTFPLTVVDLRRIPEAERQIEALRVATEQARRPFDFLRGPLLRATVALIGDGESQLIMTGHQSIIDGVSVYQVFPGELAQLYEAFADGKASPLSELSIQFADFACWQRQSLLGEVRQKQIAYWQRRLAGELLSLAWPNERPRPRQQTFKGTVKSFAWSRALFDSLQALGHRHEFTLFTILTAGYVALLHRYTRQNRIIVGTLAPAGRQRSESQGLLGYLLNPVALRFDLTPGMTFLDLLRQSQEVVVGAISHDDVPLEEVIQALKLRPDPSRNPLFTVGLSLQPSPPPMSSGWTVTSMDADNGGSRWDLYVAFIERPEGLIGRTQYNPDLFEPSTIQQMLDDWRDLLAAAAADLQQPLSGLTIRSAAGEPTYSSQKIAELGNPDRGNDQPRSSPNGVEDTFVTPQWFVSQNCWVKDPVKSNTAAYNYPILLRLQGPLALDALERGLQEIVTRHQMLRAAFQLVNGDLVADIQPAVLPPLTVTDLGDLAGEERQSRVTSLVLEGTTQAFDLSHGLMLRARLLRLAPEDHALLLNTHHVVCDDWSTGILLQELSLLYRAFSAGLPSPLPALTYHYRDFARSLESRRQNGELEPTLSFWKQNLAGDTDFYHLPSDLPRSAEQTFRGAKESAAFSEDFLRSLQLLSQQEHVSLFMTLLAAFKCLLHRYSNHENIGVGSCVANRPLTKTEGVIGPFGNVIVLRTDLSGNPTFRELLHRVRESTLTGLARQDLPFGELVRNLPSLSIDNRNPLFQVLFVFENAPKEQCQFPGLTLTRLPLDTGTTRYEINVWLRVQQGLEVELQYNTDLFQAETMKQILCDYRDILKEMVQDASGQAHNIVISREPEPLQISPGPTVPSMDPKSTNGLGPDDEVQSGLLELWTQTFGIRSIGIDDDFFELGGDSLLGAGLFLQIEKTFQITLPLTVLLEAPTIRLLAGIIGGRKVRSSDSLVVVQPLGTKPPLFCVYGHGGGIFYFGILSRTLGTDQPLYGLRLEGFGGEEWNNTVEDMATYYLREIQKIQPKGPYYLSGYCFGGMVAYEMARLLKTQGEEVGFLVLFNSPAPGSLKGWPLSCLKRRFTHELRKLRILPAKEKLAVFGHKTAGLYRLVRGSFIRALWRNLPKASSAGPGNSSRRLLSVGDLNVLAAGAYQPASYPGRIILFLTEEVGSRYAIDPERGWGDLAEGGIEIHPVAGDNVSFFHPDNVGALAEKLRFCIQRAQGGDKGPLVATFQ